MMKKTKKKLCISVLALSVLLQSAVFADDLQPDVPEDVTGDGIVDTIPTDVGPDVNVSLPDEDFVNKVISPAKNFKLTGQYNGELKVTLDKLDAFDIPEDKFTAGSVLTSEVTFENLTGAAISVIPYNPWNVQTDENVFNAMTVKVEKDGRVLYDGKLADAPVPMYELIDIADKEKAVVKYTVSIPQIIMPEYKNYGVDWMFEVENDSEFIQEVKNSLSDDVLNDNSIDNINKNENGGYASSDKTGNGTDSRTDNNDVGIFDNSADSIAPTSSPTVEPSETDKNGTNSGEKYLPYIQGYDDKTFRPDGNITRAETAQMLSKALDLSDNTYDTVFADVDNTDWFVTAVKKLCKANIAGGYDDDTFRPQADITRAEFVSMIVRAADVSVISSDNQFSDVPSDAWFADAVNSAAVSGYINGYNDGTFRPDANITRAEAVKIINSAFRSDDIRADFSNIFRDLNSSHWAFTEIMRAVN